MLRFLTAGETHGKCLTAIIEGMPSNIHINIEEINKNLSDRQKGYGRGGRMKIESDTVQILSGIRNQTTLGSPITLQIENKDWVNWEKVMSPDRVEEQRRVTNPRPGHADLPGALKYGQRDMRNILERASARETAARVAVGSIAEQLLKPFGITVYSHVVELGGVKSDVPFDDNNGFIENAAASPVRCGDEKASVKMIKAIEEARQKGDSLGGIFEVVITGVPAGLGSHVQWDRKLDARLAAAFMSIQAIKGVEIGLGFECTRKPGSEVHDEIFFSDSRGFFRETNRAGGIEGGMSNGENIIIRAAMKPIPTLYKPLRSVNIDTGEEITASIERSDVCAVPAASVVGKAVAAWELASAFMEKFGGDSYRDVKSHYEHYIRTLKQLFKNTN